MFRDGRASSAKFKLKQKTTRAVIPVNRKSSVPKTVTSSDRCGRPGTRSRRPRAHAAPTVFPEARQRPQGRQHCPRPARSRGLEEEASWRPCECLGGRRGRGGSSGGRQGPGTCPGRQGLPACPQGEIGSSVCRCPSVLLPQAPLSRRRQNTLPSEPPAALAPAEPGGGGRGSSCGCGHRGRAPRATGRARPDTCSCAVSCKQSQHSEQHFEVLRKWVKESHFVTCEQYSSLRPQGP